MNEEQIKQLKAEYSGLSLQQAAEKFKVPEKWLLGYMGKKYTQEIGVQPLEGAS